MRLRAKWNPVEETRAVLNVDVRLPSYPLHCNCPACVMRRSFVQIVGPQFNTEEHPDHKEPELSGHEKELIDGLLGIHGVVNVWTGEYRAVIEIGGVFDWVEIRPRVEAVVAEWAGAEAPLPPEPVKVGAWRRVARLFGKQ